MINKNNFTSVQTSAQITLDHESDVGPTDGVPLVAGGHNQEGNDDPDGLDEMNSNTTAKDASKLKPRRGCPRKAL